MENNDYFKPGQLFKLSYLIGRIKSIRSFKDLMQRLYSACVLFYKVAAFRYGKKYWKRLEEIRDLSKKAGLFVEQGKASAREGRYAEAEEEFKEAIKIDAKSEAAHQELGKVYYIQNRLSEAEEELGKAIKINKKNRNTQLLLAKVYSAENKYVPALDAFFKLISPGMDNTGIYTEIEIVYGISKEYDKAIKGYKQAIARGVDDGWIHLALTKVYLQKEVYDDAIKEYKEAIKRGMDTKGIHLDLAGVYIRKKDYANAIKEYKKAIEIGGDDINTHLEIARAYYNNMQYNLAIGECSRAQKSYSSIDALRIMIKAYKKLKNYDLCLETGKEYIKRENEEDVEYNKKLIDTFKAENKGRGTVEDLSVKIIRTAYFENFPKREINYSLLLPLGMARIVSYLRSNGIEVDQDDLYIKVNQGNMFAGEDERIDRDVFFDNERVIRYAQGKDDIDIEKILEKTEEMTRLKGYKVILISMCTSFVDKSGCMFVLALARFLKKKYNPLIIVGGQGNTVEDMVKYNNKNIDFIVDKKGEKPLFMLLSALKYKIDIDKIPDISITNNGKLIKTNLRSKLDIIPDFNGLPLALYEYRNKWEPGAGCDKETKDSIVGFNNSRTLVSPYVMMEGCSHECAFCCDSTSDILLSLDPKKAVEYMSKLNKIYGIKYFLFLNNTINLSKKYINELCDEIINSGLDILWCDCARGDNLDSQTLFKMRKAGCIRLIYGMETASPRLLKYVDKEINLKRLEDIISWTDEAGIWTGIEIICGFPHETKEDIEMTVDFLNKNKKHINWIYYNIFKLLPTSRINSDRKKYGIENVFINDEAKQYVSARLRTSLESAFDEIGGLRWGDKIKQMVERYDYVVDKTKVNGKSLPDYEMEHFLFYLYSKYKDKNEILRVFNKVRDGINS
ncbi:MAG: tetratricopeptide repeat protein [Elusimicrobia bacterium]|nr:tetratricopeptide repeat protein [Candidatus Liberimonas magnetica]